MIKEFNFDTPTLSNYTVCKSSNCTTKLYGLTNLVKDNYLSEYTSDLLKALVRKNIGIHEFSNFLIVGNFENYENFKNSNIKGKQGDAYLVDDNIYIWSNAVLDWIRFIGSGRSAYEVAVSNGFIGTIDEWIESLRGPKGNDGNVKFDELTENQLTKLIASTVVEQHLDPGSYNAIASRVVNLLYLDLLNGFKTVKDNVDNLLNSKIETIRQSPIIFVTEDEYNSLVRTGTFDPRVIYAVTETPVTPPTNVWTFGNGFPIVFGEVRNGFKFGDTFPITFN